MIAAIYARKSTEQTGVSDEQKSVTRQVEHARAYAERKGWTVADDAIFVDDGVSGAEFSKRPGFLRLMNTLASPPFDALVVSELSRLGREQLETGYACKQLAQAGVRIFSYLEDREIALDTPTDKFLMSAVNFAAEIEREKARQRVTDAMLRRARAGHVCGGEPFGYRNREVVGPDGRRAHVRREVYEPEADVVRRIFDLSAAGTGYTRIAKLLNADGALSPRPKRGRLRGWAPTTVKVVLERRLYLGEVTWNRTQKRDGWGQKRLRRRPATEWVQASVPELRIVSEAQWAAAHGRLRTVRERLNTTGGLRRRARDIESRYLLSGFARCAACGGGLGVTGGSHRSARAHVYGCLAYHKRGSSVCANSLKLPIGRVDEAVLTTIGGEVLRPAVIEAVLAGVFEALAPEHAEDALARLRSDLQAADRAVTNLTRAIAIGGNLEALVRELQEAQGRADHLRSGIAAHETTARRRVNKRAVEQQVRARLRDWRALLTSHVGDGRQLLREVLVGPLRFTPDGAVYRFDGEAAVGRLLAGTVGLPTHVVPVRGFEPRSRG